jgi:hypothetical protein
MDRDGVRQPDGHWPQKARADTPYAAICMLCGRTHGHLLRGRFFAQPHSAKLERDGRQLRCGHCHGAILLEADPLFEPAVDATELLARLKKEAGRRTKPRRAAG